MKKLLETAQSSESCVDLPSSKKHNKLSTINENNNNKKKSEVVDLLQQQQINMAQLMAQSMAQLFQAQTANNNNAGVDLASMMEAIDSFCKLIIINFK